MINVAIFASGTGSNAKKLIEKAQELENINVSILVTDQEDAGVIHFCQEVNQNFKVVPKKELTKSQHETEIIKVLKEEKVDLVLLAGYMRLLSQDFISRIAHPTERHSRVINIHPSLLPKYRGLNAYEQAFENEAEFSGITIHYVDAGMDTGEIILQNKFNKLPNDTILDFKSRGLALEHEMYPYLLEVINKNNQNYPALESL